jgi:anti-anti-sigma factor
VRIERRSYGPAAVISPVGAIDLPASAELQDALLSVIDRADAGAAMVVVDMAGVPFVSSAGLRALMIAAKRAHALHGKLAVAALTPDVAEIFQIARFELVVKVFADPRGALAWMSEEAAAAWDGR